MAEQTPIFLGLIRPAKLLGLPIMYAVGWLFGFALLFVWLQHWAVGLGALLSYPVVWKAADWDPHFLDVVTTVMQHTPPQRPRPPGGDASYGP